jgi:hypothetical protein
LREAAPSSRVSDIKVKERRTKMNNEITATKEELARAGAVLPAIEVKAKAGATEEQIAYAKLLGLGMKVGLLGLIATFLVYLLGILSPHVPVKDLPLYWSMPVHKYLAATGIHAGWSWLGMIGKGDFLNFVSIAFLAAVTVGCYIRLVPIFFRKNDLVYGALAILEVLVLVLAASGILKAGGH